MENNTKFNLGDVVYFVGDHDIYQAYIIEVRTIERYAHNPVTKGLCEESLELYRLAEKKTDETGFNNTNENNMPNYKGEHETYHWFPADILFATAEEALASIKIKYIRGKEPNNDASVIDTF